MEQKYIEKILETEQLSKSNEKRLSEHEKEINDLKKTYSIMAKMDYRMEQVEQSVERIDNKLDNKLDNIQKEKGMKWDKLIDYIFYAILAYCLYKLGLK